MSDKKYLEIELKYRADDIALSAFSKYAELCNQGFNKFIQASGWDHFYDRQDEPGSFCRHRVGADMNQLTFKRKTTDKNNFVRTEHNIDLTPSVRKDQVEALCREFGYKYNTTIFKNCFIYKYDLHTFVFYICYDVDMKELGRFLEIEMSEDHPWKGDEAWNQLLSLESSLKCLGIIPQRRMKTSLFEMFRKE